MVQSFVLLINWGMHIQTVHYSRVWDSNGIKLHLYLYFVVQCSGVGGKITRDIESIWLQSLLPCVAQSHRTLKLDGVVHHQQAQGKNTWPIPFIHSTHSFVSRSPRRSTARLASAAAPDSSVSPVWTQVRKTLSLISLDSCVALATKLNKNWSKQKLGHRRPKERCAVCNILWWRLSGGLHLPDQEKNRLVDVGGL